MNAKWLAHLIAYRESDNRLPAVRTILERKVELQHGLILLHAKKSFIKTPIPEGGIQKALLSEARNARKYWKRFAALLPAWCAWKGRMPHAPDIINTMQ